MRTPSEGAHLTLPEGLREPCPRTSKSSAPCSASGSTSPVSGSPTSPSGCVASAVASPQMRVVPSPGGPLAIRLYRLLEERPPADLQHVLDAVRATACLARFSGSAQLGPGPEADDVKAGGANVAFARRSLLAARDALGRIPSRPAYDAWRAGQPAPEDYASATTIRRRLGEGDWSKAMFEVGAVGPDVTARRLLANGARFSKNECRTGLTLFFAAAPDSKRGFSDYGRWARAYSRRADAWRIPLHPQTITSRLRAPWSELRAQYETTGWVHEPEPERIQTIAPPSSGTDRRVA